MKVRYTEEEFNKAIATDGLKLECYHCGKEFLKKKNLVQLVIRKHINKQGIDYSYGCKYCSQRCNADAHNKEHTVCCKQCGKEFRKTNAEIQKTPNSFCSHSCSATYNNTHKTHGTRRSKLEVWLEQQLPSVYPSLEFHFNRKDAINAELDIYIPSLKLAFELNGIFHYEPIYGPEKLAQIQNNDERKYQACLEKGIELCWIDVSALKYFKEKNIVKYLAIIQEVIDKKKVPHAGLEPASLGSKPSILH